MTTSSLNRQGLKPFSCQVLYGTVKTVPYKDFLLALTLFGRVGRPSMGYLLAGHYGNCIGPPETHVFEPQFFHFRGA